ncbi:hypothetical protein KY332_04605 [Candidatus Woesearchaeota archaeon]|nr:hypothetical protein [Candidatus Woesearchaeota archaeon]
MKKIEVFSPRKQDINKLGSIKSFLSRKIVSKSGEAIGKAKDVLFDSKGIRGVKGKGFYVDKSYFKTSEDKIMLSIDPVILLLGKDVFDADGKKIGKVVKVARTGNTNNFKSIFVKRKFYSRKKEISKADISVSKKNIILNKKYG